MSYDVSIRVKVEGKNFFVWLVGGPNITWNVKELIRQSSGWDILNEENNGPVIPWAEKIKKGKRELEQYPEKYRKYEAENGWGTVEGTLHFYDTCINMFEGFMRCYGELSDVAVVFVD